MSKVRLVNFLKSAKTAQYVPVQNKKPKPKVGLLLNEGKFAAAPLVVDLNTTALFSEFGRKFSMSDIIEHSELNLLDKIRKIAARMNNDPNIRNHKFAYGADQFQLLSPITPVRNIICVGKNYSDHIAEVKKRDKQDGTETPSAAPQYPMFFTKAPTTVIGHLDNVPSHSALTKWLDYEAELAVIIGKGGSNIPITEVMNHIFGYTCANDVSARDLQRRHGQFFKGKTLDGSCPLGPCIIPAADLNPMDLAIKLTLNGEMKQNSRTSKMIFNIPAIVSSLSEGFTLVPGDVILTGTPDGVAYAANPPFALKHGDNMVVEIEGIGKLENSVM